ncbi:hypothetical protein [Parvularcula marina]|nr:hypothetical protein [Parvularcula marina]
MATHSPRGGPHFTASVHDRLAKVSDKRLAAVSLVLSKLFSGRMALSTLFDGPRQEVLSAEEEADLKDLEAALPEGAMIRDPLTRDRFGAEPRMLAFLRQLEGHRPQAMVVLSPEGDDAADEAVAEARAMGYLLVPGERMAALKPPSDVEILDKTTGEIRFGAGTDWEKLDEAAVTAGLCAFPKLAGLFDNPLAAARAGLFGPVRERRRSGHSWRVEATLPPLTTMPEELVFLFEAREPAERVLARLTREMAPLYAETFPASDGYILATARLVAHHGWLDKPEATGLRLFIGGPEPVRRAALKFAEGHARRAGGRKLWPQGLPPRADLEAILASCGAARLERATDLALPTPEGARVTPTLRAIRGEIEQIDVITYLRDLSRSLPEAQQTLGLIEDPVRPQSPDLTEESPDSVRAHG